MLGGIVIAVGALILCCLAYVAVIFLCVWCRERERFRVDAMHYPHGDFPNLSEAAFFKGE